MKGPLPPDEEERLKVLPCCEIPGPDPGQESGQGVSLNFTDVGRRSIKQNMVSSFQPSPAG